MEFSTTVFQGLEPEFISNGFVVNSTTILFLFRYTVPTRILQLQKKYPFYIVHFCSLFNLWNQYTFYI